MRLAIVAIVGALACASLPRRSSNACRQPDEKAGWLLERVQHWVAPTDSDEAAMADSLRVPRGALNEISWILDGALCARAAAAYRETSGRPEGVSGRVYLIKAGKVYVVLDPEFWYQPGSQLYTMAIFDRRWHLLAHVGG